MRILVTGLVIFVAFVGIPIFIGKMIRHGRGFVVWEADDTPRVVINPKYVSRSLFDKPDQP